MASAAKYIIRTTDRIVSSQYELVLLDQGRITLFVGLSGGSEIDIVPNIT